MFSALHIDVELFEVTYLDVCSDLDEIAPDCSFLELSESFLFGILSEFDATQSSTQIGTEILLDSS